MRYIIVIRRSDFFGNEEYDGGTTLADARKEAQFFADNTPVHVPVRICTVDGAGRLHTKEIVRHAALPLFENFPGQIQ